LSDYALQRKTMVDSQIRPSDIRDRRLIRAMEDVPREIFVPVARRPLAYMDGPLFIPSSDPAQPPRTLLAPRTFAKLLDLADIRPDDAVLDVGCATGYSAAVLARLAGRVTALESNVGLADEARAALAAVDAANVTVATGDLARGRPENAPYNVIVLEGAVPDIPTDLRDQLADGGRLVAIIAGRVLGRATVVRRSGAIFSQLRAFDATAPALPGFAQPAVFSF